MNYLLNYFLYLLYILAPYLFKVEFICSKLVTFNFFTLFWDKSHGDKSSISNLRSSLDTFFCSS